MFTFRLKYLILFTIIFVIEVLIAVYFNDAFIRAFLGDVLVVVLIYTFFRIFLKAASLKVAIGVLLFAIAIEIAQFFNMVEILGLEDHKVARIVLGSTFDWLDLLAYLIGFVGVVLVDVRSFKKSNKVKR